MYLRLLFSQVLLLLVVENSMALSCLPCNKANCREPQCPGATVLGPCGCCYMCAKQKDEICGGPFYVLGNCDKGLKCVRSGDPFNSEGVCKESTKEPETTTHNLVKEPQEFILWLKTRKIHID